MLQVPPLPSAWHTDQHLLLVCGQNRLPQLPFSVPLLPLISGRVLLLLLFVSGIVPSLLLVPVHYRINTSACIK